MTDIKDKVHDISASPLQADSMVSWEYCEVKSCEFLEFFSWSFPWESRLSPRLWAIIMEGINLRDII